VTFLESLNALSDNVITKVIGEVEAGACVSSYGKACCVALGQCSPFHPYSKRAYSCFGACNWSRFGAVCC
jgi:hypothetical protein